MSNENENNNPSGSYDYRDTAGYQSPTYGSYSPYYQGTQYPYTPPSYGGYGGAGSYYPSTAYGATPSPYPTSAGYGASPGYQTPPAAAGGAMQPTSAQAAPSPTGVEVPGLLPSEQSYIENILRLNLHKMVTVYMTFENNPEWPAKVFTGELQAAGKDHIIISEKDTGRRYLLLMIYLNYVTFEGPINYSYPYRGGGEETTL